VIKSRLPDGFGGRVDPTVSMEGRTFYQGLLEAMAQ